MKTECKSKQINKPEAY